MAFLIPDDLITLNLTVPQCLEITELRRAKKRLKMRLLRLAEKEKTLLAETADLDAKEKAITEGAKGD